MKKQKLFNDDLFLILKTEWFDMIEAGIKTDEYRDISDYWIKRLALCSGNTPIPFGYYCQKAVCVSCVYRGGGFKPKPFKTVTFQLGYAKNARRMKFEITGISIGQGKSEWGAVGSEIYFRISLGKRLDSMSDTELINKLQKLVKERCWKISFNHDDADGYFCEVDESYSIFDAMYVADLHDIKRETLREAIIAAIEYMQNPPRRAFRM